MATQLPLSPFITDPENRFVLNEERFLADLEAPPSFLSSPRREYLQAVDIIPVLRTLAGSL